MGALNYLSPFLLLACATTVATPSNNQDMEHIVVTETLYAEHSLSDTVTISHDELTRLNKKSVTDILRTVPGLQVSTQGGSGGPSAVSIRGSEANFVAVYINDVLVNDPSDPRGSGFRFNSISPLNIERIEVIKGPASVSYGAQALAGVIRIYTREPQAWGHQLSVEGSPQQGYLTRFHFGRTYGQQTYAVNAARLRKRHQESGSDHTGNELSLNFNHDYRQDDALSVFYRFSDSDSEYYPEQSGGPELAASDDLETRQSTSHTFAVGNRNRLADNWQSQFHLSHFQRESRTRSPGIVPYTNVPPTEDDTRYSHYTFNWRNRVAVTSWLLAGIGLDHRYESGESDGIIDMGVPINADYELKRHNTGAYSNFMFRLPQDWRLQAGIRRDDPEQHKAQNSRQLSLETPDFFDRLQFTLSWGEGFKLPGFSALAHPLVGNPDLVPETVESHELQVQFSSPAGYRLAISLFDNDYRNLIDFDAALFQNVNRQHVETSGVDLSIRLPLTGQLTADIYGNHTRIDTNDSATTLTGRPKKTAGLLLLWQPDEQWQIHADYRWTGKQYAGTLHNGTTEYVELASYPLLNLRFNWQTNHTTRLSLSFDNMLNKQYYEAVGTPSPGTTIYLGIHSRW